MQSATAPGLASRTPCRFRGTLSERLNVCIQHRRYAPAFSVRESKLRCERTRDAHMTHAQKESEADTPSTASGNADAEDDIILMESELRKRRERRRGAVQPAKSAPKQRPRPKTASEPTSEAETLVLQGLAAGFAFILLEGVALAASGFLPEAADAFITDFIYPSFSWQMGIFFSCSTIYGLYKTTTTQK